MEGRRKEIVSGQFYESDFSGLDAQIRECFSSKFGPAELPLVRSDKKIISVICPHAGYMFSGGCASWAYKEIGESVFPDTFLILGLSHSGYDSCVSLLDWETPLGVVKNDSAFSSAIGLPVDEEAHAKEHSIEVQLPFLQVACKDKLDSIRIVPIIVSSDYEKVSSLIFDAIRKLNRDVVVIASSDFTHYGPNYGYVPFTNDIKESLYALDKKAIEFILKLDSSGFLDYIENKGATICGKYPIAATIELSKKLGATSGSLLRYYTSGDVSEDYSSAVGYGAIKIK